MPPPRALPPQVVTFLSPASLAATQARPSPPSRRPRTHLACVCPSPQGKLPEKVTWRKAGGAEVCHTQSGLGESDQGEAEADAEEAELEVQEAAERRDAAAAEPAVQRQANAKDREGEGEGVAMKHSRHRRPCTSCKGSQRVRACTRAEREDAFDAQAEANAAEAEQEASSTDGEGSESGSKEQEEAEAKEAGEAGFEEAGVDWQAVEDQQGNEAWQRMHAEDGHEIASSVGQWCDRRMRTRSRGLPRQWSTMGGRLSGWVVAGWWRGWAPPGAPQN